MTDFLSRLAARCVDPSLAVRPRAALQFEHVRDPAWGELTEATTVAAGPRDAEPDRPDPAAAPGRDAAPVPEPPAPGEHELRAEPVAEPPAPPDRGRPAPAPRHTPARLAGPAREQPTPALETPQARGGARAARPAPVRARIATAAAAPEAPAPPPAAPPHAGRPAAGSPPADPAPPIRAAAAPAPADAREAPRAASADTPARARSLDDPAAPPAAVRAAAPSPSPSPSGSAPLPDGGATRADPRRPGARPHGAAAPSAPGPGKRGEPETAGRSRPDAPPRPDGHDAVRVPAVPVPANRGARVAPAVVRRRADDERRTSHRPQRGEPEAPERTLRVEIGRIEVRASEPPPRPRAERPPPSLMSLADYVRARAKGRVTRPPRTGSAARTDVHVGRLVLDGTVLSRRRRAALPAAIEAELRPRLDGRPAHPPAGADPTGRLGRAIAHGIDEALRR